MGAFGRQGRLYGKRALTAELMFKPPEVDTIFKDPHLWVHAIPLVILYGIGFTSLNDLARFSISGKPATRGPIRILRYCGEIEHGMSILVSWWS